MEEIGSENATHTDHGQLTPRTERTWRLYEPDWLDVDEGGKPW